MQSKSGSPLAATAIFFTLGALLAFTWDQTPSLESLQSDQEDIQEVNAQTYQELEDLFEHYEYTWPPTQQLSKFIITRKFPANVSTISDPSFRKEFFIKILYPIVELENLALERQHSFAIAIRDQNQWPEDANTSAWLIDTLAEYKVVNKDFDKAINQLIDKLDSVPTKLVIAQAAIESGWGTSRFALEGNSLFGQWTYAKNMGLTPTDREQGKRHQVRAFKNLRMSVRSYLQNINKNHAYRELRLLRKKARDNNLRPNALQLAEGLFRYSQRGHEYVKEIKQIINSKTLRAVPSFQDT